MLSRLLIPVLVLLGLAAGLAAGLALRPAPAPTDTAAGGEFRPGENRDYVRLNNQFVVPVLTGGDVSAFVILSISLETLPGNTEAVYSREARLRDGFLRVFFDHANAGGFSGNFTDAARMQVLRSGLREVAQGVLGPAVTDVLIIDLVRQDL